jgi:hypothetical protein
MACPFKVLAKPTDARVKLRDAVAGRRVLVRHDRAHRTAEAFGFDGRSGPGTMAFRFAWVAFYPRTEVLRERQPRSRKGPSVLLTSSRCCAPC